MVLKSIFQEPPRLYDSPVSRALAVMPLPEIARPTAPLKDPLGFIQRNAPKPANTPFRLVEASKLLELPTQGPGRIGLPGILGAGAAVAGILGTAYELYQLRQQRVESDKAAREVWHLTQVGVERLGKSAQQVVLELAEMASLMQKAAALQYKIQKLKLLSGTEGEVMALTQDLEDLQTQMHTASKAYPLISGALSMVASAGSENSIDAAATIDAVTASSAIAVPFSETGLWVAGLLFAGVLIARELHLNSLSHISSLARAQSPQGKKALMQVIASPFRSLDTKMQAAQLLGEHYPGTTAGQNYLIHALNEETAYLVKTRAAQILSQYYPMTAKTSKALQKNTIGALGHASPYARDFLSVCFDILANRLEPNLAADAFVAIMRDLSYAPTANNGDLFVKGQMQSISRLDHTRAASEYVAILADSHSIHTEAYPVDKIYEGIMRLEGEGVKEVLLARVRQIVEDSRKDEYGYGYAVYYNKRLLEVASAKYPAEVEPLIAEYRKDEKRWEARKAAYQVSQKSDHNPTGSGIGGFGISRTYGSGGRGCGGDILSAIFGD